MYSMNASSSSVFSGSMSSSFGTSSMKPHKSKHKYNTGSCFDTVLIQTGEIPGGHPPLSPTTELGAFAEYHPTEKPSPDNWLRKGTGLGGHRVLTPLDKKRLHDKYHAEVVLKGPQPAGAYHKRANPPNTDFRRYYDRGDIPVKVMHGTVRKLVWLQEFQTLDYYTLLPLFFDGLREEEEPYQFLAFQGCKELLEHGEESRILPVIPQIILPLKTALNTRISYIMVKCLKCIKALVLSGESIGEALVPYYRQILPILNIYCVFDRNLGDGIDYHQRCDDNVGVLIGEVLNMLERNGGPDAFINIKYMIPTYESCMDHE